MTASEAILDQLDSVRERLLVAIEWLPDEALLEPGVVDAWSVAELLSILTAWEAETVTALSQIKRSKRPNRLLEALADPDAYNAARYTESQNRDLDSIFDDWQGARVKLEEWLEEFSDKALRTPGHFKPLSGRALQDIIAAATFEHEVRFIPVLENYARIWVEQEDTADSSIIPLAGVNLLTETDNGHQPNNE